MMMSLWKLFHQKKDAAPTKVKGHPVPKPAKKETEEEVEEECDEETEERSEKSKKMVGKVGIDNLVWLRTKTSQESLEECVTPARRVKQTFAPTPTPASSPTNGPSPLQHFDCT